MKKRLLITSISALLIAGISATTAQAGSMCNNGTYSSNSGRGTCSWNGGIDRSYGSYSDPGSSSWKRQNLWSNDSSNYGYRSNRNYRSYSDSWSSWDSWK